MEGLYIVLLQPAFVWLKGMYIKFAYSECFLSAAWLAQSVERLTADLEVAGSIPGVGPLLRVLK